MDAMFQSTIEDLKRIHKFSDDELRILDAADAAAEELAVPEFEHYIKREYDPEAPAIAKKHGLFKVPIKKEYGGLGASPLVAALVKQRLGHLGMGFGSFYNVQVFLCSLALQRWGSDHLREKYLKPAANGDKVLAFGLTEPEHGSDPASLETNFEDNGSSYVINGTKYLISNGSVADAMIVFARSKSDKKISAFVVDTKTSGFSAMRMEEKIGLFTSDTAMPEFKDMEVPKENLLGELGKGLHVAYSSLLNGRMGIAAGCVGIIEQSLSAATQRARERFQHGKLIGKHQLIQKHIAEIRQNLEMARWPLYYAAIRKEQYDANPTDKELAREMDLRASLAKKIASRLAFESADRAVQIFGGFGYSLLSPVGPLFIDSRVTRIYEGSDEIQELKIASGVLGDDFRAFD
jgi:alkylation response protein AidB-like acyl-CoA dehydrogenase